MPDTVNASIPLQSDPLAFQRGYQAVQQNMLGGMQIQQQQRALQSQNAIRQIFADPTSVDTKTEAPTANAMNRIMAIDPNVGMAIRQQVTQQERAQAGLQFDRSKINSALQDQIRDVGTDSLTAYEKALSDGHSPTEAKQVAQDVYTSGFNGIKSSGLAGPEILQNLSPTFDPVRVRTNIDWFKQRDADRRLSREDASQAETERHDRAMENRTGASPGAAAERDAEMIAADKIAAKEKEIGRPLTDGEKAAERQTARLAPKVELKKEQNAAAPGLLDDKDIKLMTEQYLAGDKSVFQNIGRGAQGAENIKRLRGEIAKQAAEAGMSGADIAAKVAEFAGITAGERTLGTRTANIGMAVNEAKLMAPLALEASKKVNRTDFPTINSIMLAGEKGTGGEDAVRLGIATNSLINIYARAISPTGVPTVSDKDHARELLGAAWSKGQYEAGVDQLMKELNAASKSPGAVRQEFRDAVHEGKEPVSTAASTVPEAKPAQKAAGGIATPTTKAEFDDLPSRAKYRMPGDPADKYRVKP